MRSIALGAAWVLFVATAGQAQLVPNDDWRTIRTSHFRIHFTQPLEEQARRAAINAERAYAQLSAELKAPRGTIDLVVSDNVDFVNGYATPFPSNRIVVFAHPPTEASGLRHYDDFNALVITHELAHIFHLDRTRGIWRLGQAVFGRNPLLFPNAYVPSWVIEGLAVYFESRLTGTGRLESSEHSMIARAAVLEKRLPTLQELAPETSRFPGGVVVYVYGSLLFDYLARTRGPETVRDFVERTSSSLFPFLLTPTSRGAFGMSFQTAWQHWRDSLVRANTPGSEILPGWRELTTTGRLALFPRWLGDTTIIYAAGKGDEVPGAYTVSLEGKERRVGRRNGASPSVPLPGGGILFAQQDYVDPYRVRTDLYVERDGKQRRLTRGARLTHPDVRADGDIVAVQAIPGSTRLVRVSPDGRTIVPLTAGTLDINWADPRWSPDGNRIAAVRQELGRSEIALLDADGRVTQTFGATRAINSAPSWSPDGRRIYFSSDRSGSPQIYVADLSAAPVVIARITRAATGVFSPEASPDGARMAAVLFEADGYHIVSTELADTRQGESADSTRISPRGVCPGCIATLPAVTPIAASAPLTSKKYLPWSSLLPRYWMPIMERTEEDGLEIGALTSGADIVGRHDYTVNALYNTRFREVSAWLWYRYAGLGLPLLDFHASANSSREGLFSENGGVFSRVGTFVERIRVASLRATLVRPRVRTFALASIGGELERRDYATDPPTLLPQLPAFFSSSPTYPALVASAGWSNARRPPLSISPEDGVTLSLNGRQRWQTGASGASTRSVVGVTTAYKSLDLPGFAHHVLAFRGAVGITDNRSPSRFSVGGVSGTTLDIFPGYSLGEQRRTFGVRGYPAGAEGGIRAYTAAVEYRVPVLAPSKGFRYIPVFIDRTSLALFGEMGRAYCPPSAATGEGVCRATDVGTPVMRSAGAELNIDTGVQLDFQARVRLGFAFPLAERERFGADAAQFYATFGAGF
ncbi:MAG TPA: LpqB family beta-propeller domain-containing protein [Gemmatimonadaceae bacterium]|nr:LpqB family beta-propeller domain-containing protein [Gemmatimonadaceae bacterium]